MSEYMREKIDENIDILTAMERLLQAASLLHYLDTRGYNVHYLCQFVDLSI